MESKQRILSEELEQIKKAKKDPRYFEPIYNKYYEPIFRFIYLRVDTQDDAHDICQQVFLKALTHIQKYKFKGFPFSSWLYRIAKSETYDFLKKEGKRRTINLNEEITSSLNEILPTEEEYISTEMIGEILNSLAEKDLILIEMRYFEQRSFQEIAEITGLSLSNAKVKVHRILQKLNKNFNLNLVSH